MRGYFPSDMFKNYSTVILHDDVLEGFVGKGYSSTNDSVWDVLVKFSVHCDVGLQDL